MNKVAAIQMCSSADVDQNLQTAGSLIAEAAQNGAKLVVLPENFAYMGNPEDRFNMRETLGKGKIQTSLADFAKQNKVWIVAGSIPIASETQHKIRATCLVYDDQGNVAARYDKVHMFNATISKNESHHESHSIEPGNETIVVNTPVGKLGIAICFDLRFPELFSEMKKKGVELFAVPSAFTVPTGEAHWELLTRGRAIDSFAYLIASTQGGTHQNGRQTYGHAVIVDPWGKIVAERKENTPGIIYADIDLQKVYEARKAIPL